MPIDLHTHSTCSDGTQTPAEVIRAAADAGLDVVALTDHDTTAGWDEAQAEADRVGITLVRGMELSTARHGISIHLLSYLHDPADEALLAEIEHARDSRINRARRIVRLLTQRWPDLTFDDVVAQTEPGTTIGRPHIADALVSLGYLRDRDEAFRDYLYDGSPYYASHYAPDVVDAVRMVRDAGGVPVMAHPFAAKRGRVVDISVIREMARAGLAGIELQHRDNDPTQRRTGERLARDLDLFVTGSSDYHGAGKSNRLGENTTHPEVMALIEARATGVPVLR